MKQDLLSFLPVMVLAGCAQQPREIHPAGQTVLLFEFPDEVRGGYGKIHGTGKATDEPFETVVISTLLKCGLRDARESELRASHRYVAVGSSSANDRDIVRCVTRSIPYRFNFQKTSDEHDIHGLRLHSADNLPKAD